MTDVNNIDDQISEAQRKIAIANLELIGLLRKRKNMTAEYCNDTYNQQEKKLLQG